jgi:DNA-binding NarL/FixJ family response regulator
MGHHTGFRINKVRSQIQLISEKGGYAMTRIRMVIVTMPPLNSEIITTLLSSYATVDVVGNFASLTEAADCLSVITPDLVLVGLSNSETDVIARNFLHLAPFAKVIVISTDSSNVCLYEAGAHRIDLTNYSSEECIKAIFKA